MMKLFTPNYLLKCTFFLTLLFFLSSNLLAGGEGPATGIKGKVLTSDGQPAVGVSVQLKGTSHGTITDDEGAFIFKKCKAGHYTLTVSLVGHEPVEKEVDVTDGHISALSIQLSASGNQLKEITVTSGKNKYRAGYVSPTLRLQEPLIEAPQSIQVVTSEVLHDQQSFSMMEDVTRNISGAQRQGHWDIYANITSRGSQMTAFRDGMNVQISPWSPLAEDMSMVDRIEFVKGPAGFMLGNGEPSGIYNVVTKKPTGQEKQDFGLTLGSFEMYRSTLDLDGKLSKDGKLLYRVNLMGQLSNTHRDYEYNNRYTIAPVLKYLVDDQTSLTLQYTQQFVQLNVIGSNYAFSKRGYGDLPRSFTTAEPNMDPTRMTDRSLQVLLEHQISPDWKFTAQAAYFNYSQVGQSMWPSGFTTPGNDSLLQRAINNWDALGINRVGQLFLNGKVHTGPVTHTILAGLDMKHSDYYADWNQWSLFGDSTFNIYKPVYGNVTMPVYDRSKNMRERGVRYSYGYDALYVQDEIGFFDNSLRLTLAGRYTTNKTINPYSGSTTDSKFTPRAGLGYSFNPSNSVYFIYDQVFLQNYGTDWQHNPFKPVTGRNLELGFNVTGSPQRWSSTIAVYQTVKNNVLVTDYDHQQAAGIFYSRQSGEQKIQGVEVDIRGELVRNLNVVVNYAYTDGKITKDTDPQFVNNELSGISKHVQNTWLTYTIGSGAVRGLRFSAGYQYQVGRVAGMVFNKTENFLPDYFRLDGGIGYQSGKYLLNLNVNNIFNKYLYTGAPSGDLFYWQAEAGRNLRLSINYRF